MSKNNNFFMVRAEIRKQLYEIQPLALDYFTVTQMIDFAMNVYYTYGGKRAYAIDSFTGNSLILSTRKLSVIIGKKASWIQIIPPMLEYECLADDVYTILSLVDTVILKIDDDD